MICPKCGIKNQDDSLYCNKCGASLQFTTNKITEENTVQKNNKKSLKQLMKFSIVLNLLNTKKKKIVAISSIVILFIAISSMIFLNNPITKFRREINDNNYTSAVKLYNEKIRGNTSKEDKVEKFLEAEVTDINKSFIDDSIDYDKAKNRLETIENTRLLSTEVSDVLNSISELNDSKIAFKKAEEFLKNDDLVSAINEYSKVISDDKNYDKSQEQIDINKEKYKEEILKNAEDSANANDYDKASQIIKDASLVLSNDTDLTAKLSVYEKQKNDKLMNEQLVAAESAKISIQSEEYKALYPDMIQVIVKNKSDKTIKDADIGCLAYDKNGYPLKIKNQFSFLGGSFEFIGSADNINVVSGASFGDEYGWNLDENHGISTVIACVKTVTFYDGSTWDNPYYEVWINQYKEKPLK